MTFPLTKFPFKTTRAHAMVKIYWMAQAINKSTVDNPKKKKWESVQLDRFLASRDA
jgi:hypothetical protein